MDIKTVDYNNIYYTVLIKQNNEINSFVSDKNFINIKDFFSFPIELITSTEDLFQKLDFPLIVSDIEELKYIINFIIKNSVIFDLDAVPITINYYE